MVACIQGHAYKNAKANRKWNSTIEVKGRPDGRKQSVRRREIFVEYLRSLSGFLNGPYQISHRFRLVCDFSVFKEISGHGLGRCHRLILTISDANLQKVASVYTKFRAVIRSNRINLKVAGDL